MDWSFEGVWAGGCSCHNAWTSLLKVLRLFWKLWHHRFKKNKNSFLEWTWHEAHNQSSQQWQIGHLFPSVWKLWSFMVFQVCVKPSLFFSFSSVHRFGVQPCFLVQTCWTGLEQWLLLCCYYYNIMKRSSSDAFQRLLFDLAYCYLH